MAIIRDTPGGQKLLADGKKIERVTQTATAGERMPPPGGQGLLTSVQITEDVAGVRRGVWEYVSSDSTTSPEQGGGRPYPIVELLGGSREVPVQQHHKFKASLSDEDIEKITNAADQKNPALLPDNMTTDALKLHELLRRKVRYYLVPSVLARVTKIESVMPNLNDLATLGGDPALPANPANTKWLQTGTSARGSGNEFEVTREYTLTGDGAQIAQFLYE